MTTNDSSRVDRPCAAYKEMQDDLRICRDLAAGQRAVKSAGVRYLPKGEAEIYQDYQSRLERASFFGAFGRSVSGLTGMVFRDDPQFDVPPTIEADLENIDAEGSHVNVFTKELFRDALEVGHSAILVDVPHVRGELTRGAERALGVRPRWRNQLGDRAGHAAPGALRSHGV